MSVYTRRVFHYGVIHKRHLQFPGNLSSLPSISKSYHFDLYLSPFLCISIGRDHDSLATTPTARCRANALLFTRIFSLDTFPGEAQLTQHIKLLAFSTNNLKAISATVTSLLPTATNRDIVNLQEKLFCCKLRPALQRLAN